MGYHFAYTREITLRVNCKRQEMPRRKPVESRRSRAGELEGGGPGPLPDVVVAAAQANGAVAAEEEDAGGDRVLRKPALRWPAGPRV